MKLSCCTDSLGHLAFEDMLDYLSARGVKAVEMTTGGWSSAPHVRMDELIFKAFGTTIVHAILVVCFSTETNQ